jgi:predicted RND superfamily exporter protein
VNDRTALDRSRAERQGGFPSEPAPPETCATGRPGYFCRVWVPWLVRHRRPVLWAALAAWVVGSVLAARLYANLRSGFEDLLPDTAPSVIAARRLGPKLHTVTHLSVIFQGSDGDALDRLADDLAARLKKLPPDLIESVEYRTDEQERFLHRFGGLYLSVDDLDKIQKRIDARVAWEKKRANPMLNLVGDEEQEIGPPPPFNFGDIEAKYGEVNGALSQFRKGYFQTQDGKLLALLVRPPEAATGLGANQRLLDAVKKEVEALQPKRYDPTLRVGYDGEVASLVEEQSALEADLVESSVIVLALVLLVIYLYFRRWTAILSIFGALAVGCALTFGLSYLLVGYLNANTAFLGSIVVGNGINPSIILVARFLEERRRGLDVEPAIQTAWSRTLAATFVASFGAGLSYLALAITDFRGFSQFGIIGGLGMALCWVTCYLLVPPLLAALDRRSKRAVAPARRSIVGNLDAHLLQHAKVLRVVAAVLLAVAALGVATYRGNVVEYDLDKLRAAKSDQSGAQYWGRKGDEIFKTYLTPMVVRADTPDDLDAFVARLDHDRAQLGPKDPIREVRTLDSAIPPDQFEKITRLKKLRETLSDSRLARLDPESRRKVEEFRPPADLKRVTLDDLPLSIRLPLTERDGTAGRIALMFPKKVGSMSPRETQEIADVVRGAIARSGNHAMAVGQSLLFLDIAEAISRDGPIATAVAFLAVVALVFVALRRVRPALLVLGSLLLGVAWLVGAAAWARVRANFLNFVVLPITFGIGVDYAVNIVQRWRLEGAGSLQRVLRETGGAVALCSLTTIIGYSSLLVADNRALRGFGLLASIGEVACLGAALVALPAFLLRPHSPSHQTNA